jgi:UDP-N-acetylmuramoylalanine--D-glutamate ligase
VVDYQGERHLAFNGEPLLLVSALKIAGEHNVANALAALALGHAAGLGMPAMLTALREFSGLKHRCQWVAEKKGVIWYNDSKGTNTGACIAAVNGLGGKGRIILLAGGQGKGTDFRVLREPVSAHARLAILFGEDADLIEAALQDVVRIARVSTMSEAVSLADAEAESGDVVLLSPACASFDMFRNFEHRGEVFMTCVEELH